MHAWAETFSDWRAVNFQFGNLLILVVWPNIACTRTALLICIELMSVNCAVIVIVLSCSCAWHLLVFILPSVLLPSVLLPSVLTAFSATAFNVLTLLVGRQEGHPAYKKTEWWVAGVVVWLERGADLHTAQLMPLPLTVSCFSKIQIGVTFLVPAHLGSPGQRAVKRV